MQRAPAGRLLGAALGLFAVLFQAILFGWHHHDLEFAGRLARAVLSAASSAATSSPAADNDGCEICQTLHHQSAATPESLFAPAPPPLAALPPPHDAAFTTGVLALAFRARAPPLG